MKQDKFEFRLNIEDDGRTVLHAETSTPEQMESFIIRLAKFITTGQPPTHPATKLNLKAGRPTHG